MLVIHLLSSLVMDIPKEKRFQNKILQPEFCLWWPVSTNEKEKKTDGEETMSCLQTFIFNY